MSGSIMTILFVLPVVLLSMLLPLALVVALQVWLCRKGKWLGLILPAITLAMSLMICLSVVGFSAVTGGGSVQVTDGHGNIVEEYHREEEHHQLQPADLAMVGGVFLVFNVPTLVLGGIWLYYKNRREWKEDLKKIDRQMAVQRSNRGSLVRVSLVGYTNVGKSTLMNLISKSDVFAENKLFATLDTTVRKVVLDNLPFLLSDTVGFIRKLPTQLVESFKSTLDEVREADLLLHVVDISHPNFEEQIAVVRETLREIGAGDKPVFMVFNKVDAFRYKPKEEDDLTPATRENLSLDEIKRSWMAKGDTPCIFISAKERLNIDKLRTDLYGMVREIHAGRYPFNNFLY